MSVSINTKFLYGSGSISFKSLRDTFRQNTGSIKASELFRNTDLDETNPVVPDATENTDIPTTAVEGADWKTSLFRGSCKEYEAVQSGTDANAGDGDPGFRLGKSDVPGAQPRGIPWNGNLEKNIKKNVYITGIVGSTNPGVPALNFTPSQTTPNVYVEVSGEVRGAGGSGGAAPGGSGNPGGPGATFNPSKTLKVRVVGSGKIYGGGGGGEGGTNGANGNDGSKGNDGSCRKVDNNSGRNCCSPCGSCPPGYRRENCYNRQGRCGWCGQYREWECRRVQNNNTAGGAAGTKGFGGTGGAGGNGRGYNNYGPGSDILGDAGNAGNAGNAGGAAQNCPGGWTTETRANAGNKGNDGSAGNPGGSGGRWGEAGGNTPGAGSGGAAGRGISGSGYIVLGAPSGSILGGY